MARSSVSSQSTIIGMCVNSFPSFLRQRRQATILDKWINGEQRDVSKSDGDGLDGQVYAPREVDQEFKDLADRSSTPWAGLVVTTLVQTAYVDGVRAGDSQDNLKVWRAWQKNRMDSRQTPLHRGAAGHGVSYIMSLLGTDPVTGEKFPKLYGFSARRMAAFYDVDDDEWPRFAIAGDEIRDPLGLHKGWTVRLVDESAVHYLECTTTHGIDEKDWTYISYDEHGQTVPPIVRYGNRFDLDGNAHGEIQPIIPMLRRIDQGMFDRLIVSRFGAWKVRYIAGLASPDTAQQAAAEKLRLSIEQILVAEDNDTKFGTLDASDVSAFITPGDQDLRYLAAITQTPPHHLLGLSSNLQAEALAAAESGLQRKSGDFRTLNGESHEQLFRLMARQLGLAEEAGADDMQVRWKPTESRSLVQTANALAVIATSLGIPVEMLWERLPDWSDTDSARAKKLIESGGVDQLLAAAAALAAGAEAAAKGTDGANGQGGADNEKKS